MTKLFVVIGTLVLFSHSLTAMVIHNDGHEKKDAQIRSESGIFNEDYLFLGYELNFSGAAEDLIFIGKGLSFSGSTKLGLISLGEKLFYSGTSGNGIIAGGMNILIEGAITGNSFVGFMRHLKCYSKPDSSCAASPDRL